MPTETNDRPDIQVVTSENLHEFLGITPQTEPQPEEPEVVEEKPDGTPEESSEETEAKQEEPEKGKPGRPKKAIQERMRELTERAKQAEADRDRIRAEVDRERKAREELEAKLKPQEPIKEANAKPNPNDFKDAFEYAEALAEWKVQDTLHQREEADKAAKEQQRREGVVANWNTRLAAAKEEIEDYDEVLASADAQVSDEIRDAIVESELGPYLLHHLASNPDVIAKINGLSARNALKELGKIEARLEKSREDKPVEPKAEVKPEVSKAPAPIRPIKSKATPDNLIDANGEFRGTPEQYRKLREAGKI